MLRAHGRARGWGDLRLLSCGENRFKYDLGSEDDDGNQDSTVSVFTRDRDGTVRHAYTVKPRMADDIDQRGIDLLCPTWHFLDLTRPAAATGTPSSTTPDRRRRTGPAPRLARIRDRVGPAGRAGVSSTRR